MKKQIVCMMLAAASAGLLGACQSGSRIDELKDFVEEVSENGKDYTEEQWEEANQEFDELMEKIKSYDDLTQEELGEVAKLQGVYAAKAFQSLGKQFQQGLESLGTALEGFTEGLEEGLSDDSTKTED